jgi:hypothetical protein
MIEGKVKIVDTFNGGEFGSFDNYEDADDELTKMRQQFYSVPGNKNSWFMKAVRSEDAVWEWSQDLGKFIWME